MEIGNNVFIDDDDLDYELTTTTQDIPEDIEEESFEQSSYEQTSDKSVELNATDNIIDSLLKDRGIEDRTKIKFENDEGETEEYNWEDLDNETKLNILRQHDSDETDLDDEEIELVNSVRRNQMTPSEFIQYIQQDAINRYVQQNQVNNNFYKVNDFTDDELFMSDFITRTNATEEEATEALERAKINEALYKKQIDGLRQEYQRAEDELNQYNAYQQYAQQQAQYKQFAEKVQYSIMNLNEFGGYDLNMDNEDMNEVYDFIIGSDSAGNSHLGKALNDTDTLVKMAWFALYGEQMIQDINDYYKKEIAAVRKSSYNKGLQDSKDKPKVVHKNITTKPKSPTFDDLDDF